MTLPLHPLDQALVLTPGQTPDHWRGQTTPDYWNMVGPYGGITAAVLLRAVLLHPQCLGEPLALTVNYAAAVARGAFDIEARPVRATRSTQHWIVTLSQNDADGQPQVMTTATVMTAVRRDTWSAQEQPMPQVPHAHSLERAQRPGPEVEWIKRYDMRFVKGAIPSVWDGSEAPSLSLLWARDEPARALDFCALAALADVFFPRIWLRRARFTPIGTVSMTVYFHVNGAELAAAGSAHVLCQARGQAYHRGFADQSAQLWSQAGHMLASTHQIAYFKE